jgi:hypothetical protein
MQEGALERFLVQSPAKQLARPQPQRHSQQQPVRQVEHTGDSVVVDSDGKHGSPDVAPLAARLACARAPAVAGPPGAALSGGAAPSPKRVATDAARLLLGSPTQQQHDGCGNTHKLSSQYLALAAATNGNTEMCTPDAASVIQPSRRGLFSRGGAAGVLVGGDVTLSEDVVDLTLHT